MEIELIRSHWTGKGKRKRVKKVSCKLKKRTNIEEKTR